MAWKETDFISVGGLAPAVHPTIIGIFLLGNSDSKKSPTGPTERTNLSV